MKIKTVSLIIIVVLMGSALLAAKFSGTLPSFKKQSRVHKHNSTQQEIKLDDRRRREKGDVRSKSKQKSK